MLRLSPPVMQAEGPISSLQPTLRIAQREFVASSWQGFAAVTKRHHVRRYRV